MDIEKLAKFVETYVRDYVFGVLGTLTYPWRPRQEGSAEEVLDIRKGRTWLFALLSISLGSVAYTAGASRTFSPLSPFSIGLILTIWLWLLGSTVAYGVARAFGGRGGYLDTLGACVRVFSAAYAISGLCAMTVGLFARAATAAYSAWAMTTFLAVEFLLLAIYVPTCVGRVHGLRPPARIALGFVIPAAVLGVNLVGLSMLPMAVMSARDIAPMMAAPPPASAGRLTAQLAEPAAEPSAESRPPITAPVARRTPPAVGAPLRGKPATEAEAPR